MKSMKMNRILLATLAVLVTGPLSAQTAVRGDLVYTMTGAPIEDGIVLISEGRIERVGTADSVDVPRGYEVREAAVVTPGLVDARNVVGLAGMYNQPSDQDQLDTSDPIQPDLRALDAYNAWWVRELGVTTIRARARGTGLGTDDDRQDGRGHRGPGGRAAGRHDGIHRRPRSQQQF